MTVLKMPKSDRICNQRVPEVASWVKTATRWYLALDAEPDRSMYAIAAATGRFVDNELEVAVGAVECTASSQVLVDRLEWFRSSTDERSSWMNEYPTWMSECSIRATDIRWDALSPVSVIGKKRAQLDGCSARTTWPGQEMDTVEVATSLMSWDMLAEAQRLTVIDPGGCITKAHEVAALRYDGYYVSGLRRRNNTEDSLHITPLVAAVFAVHAVNFDTYGWPKVNTTDE